MWPAVRGTGEWANPADIASLRRIPILPEKLAMADRFFGYLTASQMLSTLMLTIL